MIFNKLVQFQGFYARTDKVLFYFVAAAVVSIIVQLFLSTLWLGELPSHIPLFYSASWGEAQLANTGQIFILPAAAGLILLVNLLIVWYLAESQLMLKRIVAVFTFILALLFCITNIGIISIFT